MLAGVTTTQTSAAPDRALRVDAERRRQALLCAAASVFAAEGLDAPLDCVARQAGVGIATLYRRFPTRDALVEAVFEAKMAVYADRAEAAVVRAGDDPWAAFAGYVRDICRMQVADPAFGAVLLRPRQGSVLFADAHARALRAGRRLVQRARAAGAVRADLRESDLYLLVASTTALVTDPGPIPAEQAACRLVDLFLDAARAPAR
jgi:AcrR family transcriptional regulator